MINGAHVVVYSRNAPADRKFVQTVLKLPCVDAGDGWLIFALPPSEVAIHPANAGGKHEFYLLADDIDQFVKTMSRKRIRCTKPRDCGWGILAHITLPGGGKLGVYEPRHARPKPVRASRSRR